MVQNIIDALTDWMPGWAQHAAEIVIYLGLIGALAAAPLILWLGYVVAFPSKERT
ncbi:MAG: hypothetical protein WD096_01260 [Actinomycetota bacterium]